MNAESILKNAVNFIIYVIPCLFAVLAIRLFLHPKPYVFRKCLHFIAFSSLAFTILTTDSLHSTAAMFLIAIFIVYPVLHLLERGSWFSPFFVEKKPGEVKNSMVLLFVMIAAVTLLSPSRHVAAASILMWGIGDAAAALIGITYGKHVIPWRISDGKKTYEGSGAFFISALLSGLAVLAAAHISMDLLHISAIIAAAAAGTFAELVSKQGNDTVFAPAAILAVLLISGI